MHISKCPFIEMTAIMVESVRVVDGTQSLAVSVTESQPAAQALQLHLHFAADSFRLHKDQVQGRTVIFVYFQLSIRHNTKATSALLKWPHISPSLCCVALQMLDMNKNQSEAYHDPQTHCIKHHHIRVTFIH